jgi:hypothetical protein
VSSACEQNGSLDCNDPDVSIATAGSGLETVATLGRFSMCYGDVLKHAEVYWLDAGDALEDLDGCDDEKLSVATDVTCYALLRMRPLSISCAECSVVISCGKVDYDKSG